jgi:hypothetical protein
LALTKVTEGVRTLGTGEVAIGNISGSAAASAGTFLKQDGTWAVVASGIEWQAVQTTDFTAVAEKGYPCNTTSGVIEVTLPSATVGDKIALVDYAGTAETNNIEITAHGTEKIKGASGKTVNIVFNRQGVVLLYVDAVQGWIVIEDSNVSSIALASTAEVEYLVVGGGGGGGKGLSGAGYGRGGGGAGGYRTNFGGATITFNAGVTYTASVGTGGITSVDGLDSSLAGSDITNIVSTGGGSGTETAGNDGGSGGGGAESAAGGAASPVTSPVQGYAGGTSSSANSASGGGGASEVGTSVSGSGVGGDGGDGIANSITGVSVTYAGGGGGAGQAASGDGGAGGGGKGFIYNGTVVPTAGTDGLGGGGGGGSCSSCGALIGGDGGDGVVILRLLSSVYSGVTTGTPTVTTDPSDANYTIIKFTGSGTYVQ